MLRAGDGLGSGLVANDGVADGAKILGAVGRLVRLVEFGDLGIAGRNPGNLLIERGTA